MLDVNYFKQRSGAFAAHLHCCQETAGGGGGQPGPHPLERPQHTLWNLFAAFIQMFMENACCGTSIVAVRLNRLAYICT